MTRAFVDSSVFFSACLSAGGASREIMERGVRGDIGLVTSALVLSETERNLAAKAPVALPYFRRFVEAVPFEIARPSKADVVEAAAYTALKDAPIVAAARHAAVDFLCSLDRRHLVEAPDVARRSGLRIALPEEVLRHIRGEPDA